ncbi:MAG TPA: rhomboid family intramembrane serine protease [Solirubrobacteraceae bacterium]|nr:rhomboid family intramembrane serine protease [Solirubrobacteraceae bacterium]
MTEADGDRLGSRAVRRRTEKPREGLVLLAAIVLLMWLVEAINSLDGNALTGDGIHARDVGRFWGILTAPFIHGSFQHLLDNTVPFAFLGVIIALHGAGRLLLVTGFIIVIGGLGTWAIGPAGASTIGASGVVFGYATYLLARGFFDRSLWELAVGLVVGLVWGAALISSLVPHAGISWQAHLCGAVAGVIVAWRLSRADQRRLRPNRPEVSQYAGG